MIEQTKAWAIAAIVSLAAPGFLALQPDAARAQSVCGRNARVDYFETQNHAVSICNEGGSLALIAVNRRDDRSVWARAMQSGSQSYRARTGDTEYFIDRDRLAIYQNGWQMASELVLLPSGGRYSESYNLSYDYEAGYRNGYDEGWRMGNEDRDFSYDLGRAMGNAGNGSDEYSRGYRAGFHNGYGDGYDGRRYDLRR